MKNKLLFAGWCIIPKRRKRVTWKQLKNLMETGCLFTKKPTKYDLEELIFDAKLEKVSRIKIEMVDKRPSKHGKKR